MPDNTLKTLQFAELDILKQVKKICDNNNIIYYAVGGTLLGAVRHKGFIPWDDDIDIAIPRPDYDRFLTIAMQELKEPYQLTTIDNRPNGFCYYYARAENKSVLIERVETKMKKVVPAWIDIFPLDGVPSDRKTIRRWMKRGNFGRILLDASQYSYLAAAKPKNESIRSRFINEWFYRMRFDRLISTEYSWRFLNNIITKYDYNTCRYVTNFCGRYGLKEITLKDVFGNGTQILFEDLVIRAPSKYDVYLRQIYGDYMMLPPENERTGHYIKIV